MSLMQASLQKWVLTKTERILFQITQTSLVKFRARTAMVPGCKEKTKPAYFSMLIPPRWIRYTNTASKNCATNDWYLKKRFFRQVINTALRLFSNKFRGFHNPSCCTTRFIFQIKKCTLNKLRVHFHLMATRFTGAEVFRTVEFFETR